MYIHFNTIYVYYIGYERIYLYTKAHAGIHYRCLYIFSLVRCHADPNYNIITEAIRGVKSTGKKMIVRVYRFGRASASSRAFFLSGIYELTFIRRGGRRVISSRWKPVNGSPGTISCPGKTVDLYTYGYTVRSIPWRNLILGCKNGQKTLSRFSQ